MNCDLPPAQRLLIHGITASTFQLVRALRDSGDADRLATLVLERRRMLRELQAAPVNPVLSGMLAALAAAVAESDRTVELLAA